MSSQREGGGDGSSDGVTTNPVSSPRGGGKGHGYGSEVDGGGEDFRTRRSSLGGTNTLMNSLNLSGWPPGPESIIHTDGFENNDVVLEASAAKKNELPTALEIKKFTEEVTRIMEQHWEDWSQGPKKPCPGFAESVYDLYPISIGSKKGSLPYFKDFNVVTTKSGGCKCAVICKNMEQFSTFVQGRSEEDISLCNCRWQTVKFENGFKGEGGNRICFTFTLLFEERQWELQVHLLEIVAKKFEKRAIADELRRFSDDPMAS
ncbi:hypothetical protein TrVE_jg5333 [Triparma verrucosa]|uniref:Uncharacterized protein n=1 Tax=Triparma verrucosa TaxID=1606542 RepID=A0A9W7B7Z7_9STRA|nr:hypothetical protein TrVE_jg5333 [Triparma verrucosa]